MHLTTQETYFIIRALKMIQWFRVDFDKTSKMNVKIDALVKKMESHMIYANLDEKS
jgi:hypothetical protein